MIALILFMVVGLLVFGVLFSDTTIDGSLLILYDNWPGPIDQRVKPQDGPLDATQHNVPSTVTTRPNIGTKISMWNDGANYGIEGPSIFTYLLVGTQNSASGYELAAKMICVPDSATDPYTITNDPDDCLSIGDKLCAVAISAMTDAYYGWFFTAGVVPADIIVTGGSYTMDGTFGTDDSVVAGDFTAGDMALDKIGWAIIAATTSACGYAIAADA